MSFISKSVAIVLFVLAGTFSLHASGAEMALAILKGEIIESRRTMVADNIALSSDQELLFWELYDEYVLRQKPLLDEGAAILASYSDSYHSISSDLADELSLRSFKNETRNTKLLQKTYKKMRKQISVPVALRFTQIIKRINLKFNMRLSQMLPIIESENVHEMQKGPLE